MEHGNYSGEVEFTFEVERYQTKDGRLLPIVELYQPGYEDLDYKMITLQIEGRSYFQGGKFSGLPENCYPDDGDTEITSVIGPDKKDWEDQLTKKEKESIIEMIEDKVSNLEPDFDEYDMDEYDPQGCF